MKKLKLNVPTWVTVALGALLGLVGALNVAAFDLGNPWSQLVTFVCAGAATLGVAPLTHGALRNALHLPFATALSIAGGLTTVCAGVTATHWDNTVKGIVVGVLTAAAGVIAGPDTASSPAPVPPVPDPPAPAPQPATALVQPAPAARAPRKPPARKTQ